MIADLKPYPAMKDSGVEWLGKVPRHWDVVAVKRHYSIQLGKMLQTRANQSTDVEVPYLKAQHVQWFSVQTADAPKMWASPSDIEQFGIRSGDLLVCEGGEGGRSSLVKDMVSGYIIQNALHRVRAANSCGNDYLQYVMNSAAAAGWLAAINNKATIAHFTREKFGSLCIPFPSFAEQAKVVRYLDYVGRRVQQFVKAKQKLIKLLEEQKQAIIHHAVTRGLDPDVPLKDSGVEWLGKVPEHWDVVAVKRHYSIQLGKMLQTHANQSTDVEVLYLKARHVQWFSVQTADAQKMWASPRDIEKFGIRSGDLLVCEGGEGGRSSLVKDMVSGYIIQNALHRVRGTNNCRNDYLQYVMNSVAVAGWLDAINNKATIAHFTGEKFGSLCIPFPSFTEQTAIAECLDKAIASIDAAIARTRREIELLQEYHPRLTADVVTGKIDVRDAAANLPDEPDEPEPIQKGGYSA
ncbi:MAG: restriction endonuclease subunit S [Gammaproteobacteria bacterium]|nr:restriction endonuclease subunit S [Gammaproteobacteria bacterium]